MTLKNTNPWKLLSIGLLGIIAIGLLTPVDAKPPSGQQDENQFEIIFSTLDSLQVQIDGAVGDFQGQINTLTNNLATHVIADGDLDPTNELELPCSGCIGSTEIENNSITGLDIENAAIDSLQIAPGAVDFTKIESHTIKGSNIENAAIDSLQIASGAVGTSQIATDAVGSLEMQDIQLVTSSSLAGPFFESGGQIVSECPANEVMTGIILKKVGPEVTEVTLNCTPLSTP